MITEPEIRAHLVEVSHRLHREGFVAATDGNLSVRLPGDLVLVTRSAVPKNEVTEEDIVKIDLTGRVLSGSGRPSSELAVHLAAYRVRPDVRAVIHAHPVTCVAFSLSGLSLAGCLLPEVVLDLGTIPTAEYATPGTERAAEVVARELRTASAVVMDRHGSITVGRDLDEAYNRLERMEHAARITHLAMQLGPVRKLSPAELEELLARKRARGELAGVENCNSCGACLVGELRRA
ncbi:MAG: class II aldolase/adducin family protein [Planctomycetes bacterium]|nr:class II aldolase/adducin family protein [Planctomycetota bacterium]